MIVILVIGIVVDMAFTKAVVDIPGLDDITRCCGRAA
jgi:hypothetical protein